MHGVDLLSGGINCVDWAAGDCHIYGRAWDSAQLVYFRGVCIVCVAWIYWVRGIIAWTGRLGIGTFMGGRVISAVDLLAWDTWGLQ